MERQLYVPATSGAISPLKVQETSNNHGDPIKRRGPHVLPHQVLRARTYLQVKGTAGNDGRSLGRLDQLRDSGPQVPSWSRGLLGHDLLRPPWAACPSFAHSGSDPPDQVRP